MARTTQIARSVYGARHQSRTQDPPADPPKPSPLVDASPFRDSLKTNDPLSPEDASRVKELILDQQLQLDILDSEIAKLRDQLKLLEEQRWPISDFVNQHMNLVAPLRSLPDDILQEIFVRCADWNDLPGSMSVDDPPTLLTRVCRSWRKLAFNTPRLWSRMHIPLPSLDVSKPEEVWESRAAGIKQWLSRSGAVPLSFHIVEPVCFIRHGANPDEARWNGHNQARALFNIIRPYAHRWLELQLVMTEATAQPFIHMDPTDVPCLKTLKLCHFSSDPELDSDFRPFALTGLLKAPVLEELSLSSFPDFDQLQSANGIDWGRLTKLFIDSISVNAESQSFFDMLRSVRALESLRVQITSHHGGGISTSLQTDGHSVITLPHLRSLGMYEHYYSPAPSLGNILHCPLLEELEYYDPVPPNSPQKSLVPETGSLGLILSHSGAHVRSLTLNPLLYTTQQIIDCLRYCPELESLLMVETSNPFIRVHPSNMINDQLFKAFVTPDPSFENGVLCPRLSSLGWDHPSSVDFEQFLDFLEKKQSETLDGVCRLRVLVGCFEGRESPELCDQAMALMPEGRKGMALVFQNATTAIISSMRDGSWYRLPHVQWHSFSFDSHLEPQM